MTFSDLDPETRETLWRLARERLDADDTRSFGAWVDLQAPLRGGEQATVRFPVLTFADGTHALGEPVIVEPKAYTMGVDVATVGKDTPYVQPGDKLKLSGSIFGGAYTVRSVTPELMRLAEDYEFHLEVLRRQMQERELFGLGGSLPDPGRTVRMKFRQPGESTVINALGQSLTPSPPTPPASPAGSRTPQPPPGPSEP